VTASWVDAEPWERRARLARVHPRLTEDCLLAAGRSVPALRPEIDAQRTKDDRLRVVFRYFGDEGNPNPDPDNPPPHGPAINGVVAAHECPRWVRINGYEPSSARSRGKPRHRHPDPIPVDTVKTLKLELERRRACSGNRKLIRERELQQDRIAQRLALERPRIQQAEKLQRVGWDLLRSHPEFSANDGFVRWPQPREAARLLASE
jgi:hypothetical protein